MYSAIYRRVSFWRLGIFLLIASTALAESADVTHEKLLVNRGFIEIAANKFNVDAQILSAIIFTERTLNYDWTDERLDVVLFSTWKQNSSIGFAQVKVKTAYFIERQFSDSTSVFYPGEKYEALLSVSQTKEELIAKLLSDSLNTCYAAAYLRLMSSRWEKEGYPIHKRPEILGTLYSTGLFQRDGSERSPRTNPRANEFGSKVREATVLFQRNGSVTMEQPSVLISKTRFNRLTKYALWGLAFLLFIPSLVIVPMRWVNPEKSSYMLQQIFAGRKIHNLWTPFDEISPYLVLAVIAAEDAQFTKHSGFDVQQIKRALAHNRIHKTTIGASTISQQVAKNLFLWRGKSYFRKGLEAYLTVLIELYWSKRRILEIYLNIAEMGPDVYGVGVASKHFFEKSQASLTPSEAASIAAILPNPRQYTISNPSAIVKERKVKILKEVMYMESIKYLKDI